MAFYADVILPLPLYASFTYLIPEDMVKETYIGSLVLVQFGKKKFYTGIVEAIHDNPPSEFEPKPITALLSDAPAIRYPQIKLWQWVADYYLCSKGDLFKAALPSGMKPESETYVAINPDYEFDGNEKLTEKQALVFQLIDDRKRIKISDIQQETNINDCVRIVNVLLQKGLVEIDEKVVERYRPKKLSMVKLRAERDDQDKLHAFFDIVSRSRKQEKALIAWLDMSKWLNKSQPLANVQRADLQERADVSPAVIKAMVDKGIFEIYKKSVNRFVDVGEENIIELPSLSNPQNIALKEIKDSFKSHDVTLLHGITGSGKTEIYCHLIKDVLAQNNQVLFLVPEISLTTQLTDRLRRVFGKQLIVYHSKFSDNERVDIWNRLLTSNEPLIIIGARSSVFLPFARLGLVIVDEEHETSFKQYDPAPRYNARDTAIVLASMHGAKTLLGSATPSIETYYKAVNKKFGLVELTQRFHDTPLPHVEVLDMSQQRRMKAVKGILSDTLRDKTLETLKAGKQAIMFQNRRGFAPYIVCQQCGWTPKCKNCDVSMVYHKHLNQLRCHYCGAMRDLPSICPACGENSLHISGYGTERIAEELHDVFKDYRISRMDLDTTRRKDAYQDIIEEFSRHETDILVGTQMVTKGLDFGNVQVVGVLNADSLLSFPDFRANERAFNMLEQVAGRAGRIDRGGEVIIQTHQSDHPVLGYVCAHNYFDFYNEEIKNRKSLLYPPFSRIINIYIKHKDQPTVNALAQTYAQTLRKIFGARVLGPEPPFVSRVATWYIQSIMLKVEANASMKKVKEILRTVYESMARDSRMKRAMVYYDVDPV